MGRIQIGANANRSALALSSILVNNPQTIRFRNPSRIATRLLHMRGGRVGVGVVVATLESSTTLRGFSSVQTTSAGKEKDQDDENECETKTDDGPVTRKLRELIAGGSVQPDPHQLRASRELDRLYCELIATAPVESTDDAQTQQESSSSSSSSSSSQQDSGGFWSGLFGGISNNDGASDKNDGIGGATGIYTYGGVGCGKTFLMELFYEALDNDPHWSNNKQIVHYHKFMLNVHQFMHTSKQEQKREEGMSIDENRNPIDGVVDHVLKSGRLLCLDEFQVTDVADAMILKELFWRLWKRGCILVTTSNRPPRDLYLNGLQRDRFLPFVDSLEDKCNVVSLMENETDYRMVISAMDNDINNINEEEEEEYEETTRDIDGSEPLASNPTIISKRRARQVYFCGRDQQKILQKLFYERARGRPTNPSTLETQGRKVKIPLACKAKSVCMFSFEDLCQKALGAADYLVIGQHFSTVFVYGVPEMTVNEINWLRRFITFVDSMYEWKVRVLLQTNAGSIEEIFVVEDKASYQQDEVFAFDRTRSRLSEMSTTRYLSGQWLGGDTTATTTSRLDLEPSLADQWFELVGGGKNLAEQQQNNDEDIRCKELFDRLDSNRDGVLDKDEIKVLMTDAFGYEPVDLVVDEMIASVDSDQNGVIDLEEFRALLAEIRHHSRS
jgi:protein AFG1